MSYAELIQKLQTLPGDKRAEVFDFVDFLTMRSGQYSAREAVAGAEWTDVEFSTLAMQHALRGMEDESVVYTKADLKEVWR